MIKKIMAEEQWENTLTVFMVVAMFSALSMGYFVIIFIPPASGWTMGLAKGMIIFHGILAGFLTALTTDKRWDIAVLEGHASPVIASLGCIPPFLLWGFMSDMPEIFYGVAFLAAIASITTVVLKWSIIPRLSDGFFQ